MIKKSSPKVGIYPSLTKFKSLPDWHAQFERHKKKRKRLSRPTKLRLGPRPRLSLASTMAQQSGVKYNRNTGRLYDDLDIKRETRNLLEEILHEYSGAPTHSASQNTRTIFPFFPRTQANRLRKKYKNRTHYHDTMAYTSPHRRARKLHIQASMFASKAAHTAHPEDVQSYHDFVAKYRLPSGIVR